MKNGCWVRKVKNHWFKERFRKKEKDSEALVGSVLFSGSVVSDSFQPHGLQQARLPVHHQLLELTQTQVH